MSASPDPAAGHSRPFLEGVADERLLLQRCGGCGSIPSFPRIACPFCFAELAWFEATGLGSIRTYSILHRTHSEQYAAHLPIVLALIALDEGSEMISTVIGPDRESAEIGATVRFAGSAGWSRLPQFRLSRARGNLGHPAT